MNSNKPSPFRISALAALFCALALFTSCEIGLEPLPSSVEAEMQKAIDRGFDGMILYVNQPGNYAFYSAGWKNREAQIKADPHDLFKIASISKLYMAAATAKLVANQTLSLESTLAQLLPEVASRIENAHAITLQMMLQHRSGIPEYIFLPSFQQSDPAESYLTTAELIFDTPADFAPDKKYRYSNTNYLLLGEILDRTLGYSHHQYIKDELLLPLGLHNTYSLYSEVDYMHVMSGYSIGSDDDLKPLDYTRPGGSMVASAEDVGKFVRALVDGTLLSEKEQAIYASVYKYEHTGWLPGYTSIVRYHPNIDAVVVQFVNTSSNEIFWLKLNRVYGRIVRILEKQH